MIHVKLQSLYKYLSSFILTGKKQETPLPQRRQCIHCA